MLKFDDFFYNNKIYNITLVFFKIHNNNLTLFPLKVITWFFSVKMEAIIIFQFSRDFVIFHLSNLVVVGIHFAIVKPMHPFNETNYYYIKLKVTTLFVETCSCLEFLIHSIMGFLGEINDVYNIFQRSGKSWP